MTLIVEDGTGLNNANAYFSVSQVSDYHSFYGNTEWTYRSDLQERAIARATQAFDVLFGDRVKGTRLKTTQSLVFPVTSFYTQHGRYVEAGTLPSELLAWISEVALLDLQGKEIIRVDTSADNLQSESSGIDVINKSKSYFKPQSRTNLKKANNLIAPLLDHYGIRVSRG